VSGMAEDTDTEADGDPARGVTDPRDRYDELLSVETRERLSLREFARVAVSEVATVGWLVVGWVLDEAGRMLLTDQPCAESWLSPGGALEPGGSLVETRIREVREETGVECTPVRPRAVVAFTFEDDETGETGGWNVVHYEARAETTALDDDPGLDDEEIEAVDWFGSLPPLLAPHVSLRAYRRCAASDA